VGQKMNIFMEKLPQFLSGIFRLTGLPITYHSFFHISVISKYLASCFYMANVYYIFGHSCVINHLWRLGLTVVLDLSFFKLEGSLILKRFLVPIVKRLVTIVYVKFY
jgi:hypothetical protein